jgi:hypothetical protein
MAVTKASGVDMNGLELILDADADTSITADTDDQIDIKVGGTDVITLTNSSLVLKGTTPTITIGDAGAEDTKIVFDGNAQDFHIGLDDTDDDFKIGLGSALGTTAHIVIDETGAVTKPLQPAFQATATDQANVTGDGTAVTPVYAERFDQNSDFDGTSTFTAPVTGRYLIGVTTDIRGMAAANTTGVVRIVTSNLTYPLVHMDIGNIIQDGNIVIGLGGTVLADFDAADTATVLIDIRGATQVVDLQTGGVFYACLLA